MFFWLYTLGLWLHHTCWQEPHLDELPVSMFGIGTSAVIHPQLVNTASIDKDDDIVRTIIYTEVWVKDTIELSEYCLYFQHSTAGFTIRNIAA